MKFLATFCLLLVSVASFAQRTPYTFATLTNLVATDPRSYSGGGVASLLVLGRTTAGDWGRPKVWNYSASASGATNQWNVAPASGVGRLSTVETNDFLPLVAGSANPITGSLSLESPFTTNQAIRFKYPTYPANPPVGISAGLYGTGEHYLRFGSINTNTWNMLNSWLTIDGEAGNATFLGPVTIGGVTRTNWPSGATNIDAAAITSGLINISRIPTTIARTADVPSLTGENSYAGGQTFNAPVTFTDEVTIDEGNVSELVITNLLVPRITYGPSWATTYQSNAAPAGDVRAAIEAATADTGVTPGTYPLSLGGYGVTLDAKGRATAIDTANFQDDFDLVEEYVGPTGYSLFVGTANGGAAANGTVAVTLNNLVGMSYISTSGSNAYPQNLLSAAFVNSGMGYAQVRARFRLPLLSTDADVFEWQLGIFDLGTTTNRPKAGAWVTSNTNLGTANVYLFNGTNSTYSFVDTGIPFTNNTWLSWSVRLTPSNSIAFYGNTPVATNSSSYPTSTFLPSWGLRMSRYLHTASATRFLYIDRQQATFRAGAGR